MKTETSFKNHLTWSAARAAALHRCPRHYYYQHIGSWEGWDPASPAEVQSAYHLKYLSGLQPELWLLIHDRIKSILDRAMMRRRVPIGDEIKIAQWNFERFLRQSACRDLDQVTRKKRKLLVDELGQPLQAKEIAYLMQRIELLLQGFFGFPDVQTVLNFPQDLLPEFLDPQNFDIGTELDVPARIRTDAVWVKLDTVVVADWKCGRPSPGHHRQALTYDIHVRRKLGLSPGDNVEVRLYYLAEKQAVSLRFTEDERQEQLWQIGEDFALLQSHSDDPEINTAPISRFRARVGPACQQCPFQLMCPDFIRAQSKKLRTQEIL